MIKQSQKIVEYKIGDVVRYTSYENDLINEPYKKPMPDKYFKVQKVDMDWGVVDYGKDTVGLAYIRKTNFIEILIFNVKRILKKYNIVYIKFEYWKRKDTKWFDWCNFNDFKLLTMFKFLHLRITKSKKDYDDLPHSV